MPPIPTLLPSEEIDRNPCRSKNCMKILKTLVLLKLWKKNEQKLYIHVFIKSCKQNYYKTLVFFGKKLSGCAAIHTPCVTHACDRVWSIILLPRRVLMSFVLVLLTKPNVSGPKHCVIWSHRTDVGFPILRGKSIQYFSVSAGLSYHF